MILPENQYWILLILNKILPCFFMQTYFWCNVWLWENFSKNLNYCCNGQGFVDTFFIFLFSFLFKIWREEYIFIWQVLVGAHPGKEPVLLLNDEQVITSSLKLLQTQISVSRLYYDFHWYVLRFTIKNIYYLRRTQHFIIFFFLL